MVAEMIPEVPDFSLSGSGFSTPSIVSGVAVGFREVDLINVEVDSRVGIDLDRESVTSVEEVVGVVTSV